jgi:hypothetical protein
MAAGYSGSPEVPVESNRSRVALRRILLPISLFGPACIHYSFPGVCLCATERSGWNEHARSRAGAILGAHTCERVPGAAVAAAEQEIRAERAGSAGRRAGSDGRGRGLWKRSDRPASQANPSSNAGALKSADRAGRGGK